MRVGIQPEKHQRPNRAGSNSAYDRQVSRRGRQLLLWLVRQQQAMTSPAEQLELHNQGIPWRPAEAAAALGVLPASVARTVARLEGRRLVFCWATGEGRGRRVSHVKLTWAAEKLASYEDRYEMSPQQLGRKRSEEHRKRMEDEERTAAWYHLDPDETPDRHEPFAASDTST